MDTIDGTRAESLIAEFGSPLFVVSERKMREQIRILRAAFVSKCGRCIVAYSYKTNYLPGLCAIARQEGLWAEVVSEVEYGIAELVGVQGDRIIFNGPWKSEAGLRRAAENGSVLNADSLDEILRINRIGEVIKKTISVGIRVNFRDMCGLRQSRFGINVEGGDALSAVRIARDLRRVHPVGLHLHLGTNINDPFAYSVAAKQICTFAKELQDSLGLEMCYFDLGGGFPCADTPPKWAFGGRGNEEWVTPPIEIYAEALTHTLMNNISSFKQEPILIVEPGRFIVGPSVFLLTKVISKKRQNGILLVVVDAGLNLVPSAQYLRHPMKPATLRSTTTATTVVCGPSCSEYDILGHVEMPEPQLGDTLVVCAVGAYSISASTQFSFQRPAVVMIGLEGEPEVLRKPELHCDLWRLDQIPSRLQQRSTRE